MSAPKWVPEYMTPEEIRALADEVCARTGGRFIGHDDLDPVTVERCAAYHDAKVSELWADRENDDGNYGVAYAIHVMSAAAIRRLSKEDSTHDK